MDFAGLKAAVESSLSRADTPDHIYELALAEINRDMRIKAMEVSAALTIDAESVSTPSGYLEMIDLSIEVGGITTPILPHTTGALNIRNVSTGQPVFYAETSGALEFYPAPDGAYAGAIRYYEKNAALVNNADTNPVLTQYPAYYLYTALKHASVRNKDDKAAMRYATAQAEAKASVGKAEMRAKISGPMTQRPARNLARRR